MKNFVHTALLACVLSLAFATPSAARWRETSTVDLATAKTIADAAEVDAAERGLAVSIVILDDAGRLVLARRMDGARYTSLDIATDKAETVLVTGRATRMIGERLDGGAMGILALDGLIPFPGGLPIRRSDDEGGDALVGAIGVSGARADDDEAVARAGLATLTDD